MPLCQPTKCLADARHEIDLQQTSLARLNRSENWLARRRRISVQANPLPEPLRHTRPAAPAQAALARATMVQAVMARQDPAHPARARPHQQHLTAHPAAQSLRHYRVQTPRLLSMVQLHQAVAPAVKHLFHSRAVLLASIRMSLQAWALQEFLGLSLLHSCRIFWAA